MCGIAGIWNSSALEAGWPDLLAAMSAAIRHRGPDGAGEWADTAAGIAFAHRRLSIVDLTDGGRQPMRSYEGRYVVTFNGEIYNYRVLRRELEASGLRFRTDSDTEVLLGAASKWGVRKAIERFVGMFAFALFDTRERRLYLARDRLGKKPLYYSFIGSTLIFGSELKAIRAFNGCSFAIDEMAIRLYLHFGYVPAPFTIYEGVQKLAAAELLSIGEADLFSHDLHRERYWSPSCPEQITLSEGEALEQFRGFLTDAVRLRMIADVPIGAFLSGGIDSSLVVATMQSIAHGAVRTFSIGFEEQEFDESPYARNIAGVIGTDHSELIVDSRQALDVIADLPKVYDEPFADPSAIPTTLLCRLTRKSVTVALSGDGGDESFGGYTRYKWMTRLQFMRDIIGTHGGHIAANVIQHFADSGKTPWRINAGNNYGPMARARERAERIAAVLNAPDFMAAYHALIGCNTNVSRIAKNPIPLQCTSDLSAITIGDRDPMLAAQMADLVGYLPDGIMVKVDRASMASALEARAPLMDHRIVEFGLSLPKSLKTKGGKQKWLLRRALYDYVPEKLVERPKRGFSIPLDAWLAGPLRDWANDLLRPALLRSNGMVDAFTVTRLWQGHQSGRRRAVYELWNILMLQAWYSEHMTRK